MIIIPTGDGVSSFFSQQVTLEGTTYTLEFRWNVRGEFWSMSIFDATGQTAISTGHKLNVDYLIGKFYSDRDPPGLFLAYDTSGDGVEMAFEDLGNRVQLIYFESTELA